MSEWDDWKFRRKSNHNTNCCPDVTRLQLVYTVCCCNLLNTNTDYWCCCISKVYEHPLFSSFYLSIVLYNNLSIYLSFYITFSVYISICLFIILSIILSIYLSIVLYNILSIYELLSISFLWSCRLIISITLFSLLLLLWAFSLYHWHLHCLLLRIIHKIRKHFSTYSMLKHLSNEMLFSEHMSSWWFILE